MTWLKEYQLESNLHAEEKSSDDLQKTKENLEVVASLLPDAANSIHRKLNQWKKFIMRYCLIVIDIQKLTDIKQNSLDRLLQVQRFLHPHYYILTPSELAQEWEKFRAPLIEKYRNLKWALTHKSV